MAASRSFHEQIARFRDYHATHKTFDGTQIFKHLGPIKQLIDRTGCSTMLDYGCGKGRQYTTPLPIKDIHQPMPKPGQTLEAYFGVAATKYDPAVPGFDQKPEGTFDLVVCVAVLGSVPETDLGWVVDEIYGYARKAVYIGIHPSMAKKRMNDGLPGYITQRPKEFWMDHFSRPTSLDVVVQYGPWAL